MSRQMWLKKLIGGTSNNAKNILYKPADTSRATTNVKAELDRINQGLTYSTTEVDTGKTWINGKKIYRKTIQAIKNQTGALELASGLDAVISYNGVIRSYAGYIYPIPYTENNPNGMFTCINGVDTVGKCFIMSPNSIYGNGTVEVCIEYTKA